MLRDFWVVNDLKLSINCPFELAERKAAIAIVGNHEFKSDTLTGSNQSHRTNVMFIQPESDTHVCPEEDCDSPKVSATLKYSLSNILKYFGSSILEIKSYKTQKRREPPLIDKTTCPVSIDTLKVIYHPLYSMNNFVTNKSKSPQEGAQVFPYMG